MEVRTKQCPRCWATVDIDVPICPNCGYSAGDVIYSGKTADTEVCKNCGSTLIKDAKTCEACGATVEVDSPKDTGSCLKSGKPGVDSAIDKPKTRWLIPVALLVGVIVAIFLSFEEFETKPPVDDSHLPQQTEIVGQPGQVTGDIVTDEDSQDDEFSDYRRIYANVIYEYANQLQGQDLVTVLTVDSVSSKYFTAKTPNAEGKIRFDFDKKLKDIEKGDVLTIAGTLKESKYGTSTLSHCSIIGNGEIAQSLRDDADNQRSLILQKRSEDLQSLVRHDFDTSDYTRLSGDILYEYGGSLTGSKVVTVIVVKEVDDASLKADTDNHSGLLYSIECKFQDSSDIAGVEKGDRITIAGVVEPMTPLLSTKTLSGCVVVGLGEIAEELVSEEDAQKQFCEQFIADSEKAAEEAVAQSKADYIAECKTVDYSDVARNPGNYNGSLVKFSGKVIQESEGWFNSLTLRVEDGDNIWYVTYTMSDGESRILEDDKITVYGECSGVTSYKTVLGSTVTIPSVKMKYYSIG